MLQGLLLSAYLKMLLADPTDEQLLQQVGAVYERYSHFMDADLQQRAVEYQGLLKRPDVANRNVTAMPKWEKRKSLLLRRMAEKDVSAVVPEPLHAACPVYMRRVSAICVTALHTIHTLQQAFRKAH